MPENDTDTTTAEHVDPSTPATETDGDAADTDSNPDWETEAKKWKALSRQNEARAKEALTKAQKFDEIEEANKSELQKLTEALGAAEKAKSDAVLESLRLTVANDTGIPADLLVGNDGDALRESAKRLTDFRGGAAKAAPAAGQGNVGKATTDGARQLTVAEMAGMTPEQIVAADDAGQFNEMRGIR